MNNCFALMHTWPELRNAEYEVVQRIVAAAKNAGRSVVVIDNMGTVVWASTTLGLIEGERLDPDIVDFIISLHFESPRLIDRYSYYAIWQPYDYYGNFGYARSTERAATHNDGLSCDSSAADTHYRNLLAGYGRAPAPQFPTLFHMLPEPYLTPAVRDDSRLFYVGINWERLGRSPGRFHQTLLKLERRNLIDIYGPESMMGVAPWEGYESYRGALPFNGVSVCKAIHRSGICLALSSAEHKRTGIMSNRLFEGVAGGAAVIATDHPIVTKYFKDLVYIVDDTRGEDALGEQIIETLQVIREDPDEANRRVRAAQQVLRDVFSLEGSIERLFATHPARVADFAQRMMLRCDVTLVVDLVGMDADAAAKTLVDLQRQEQCALTLHLLCDTAVGDRLDRQLGRFVTGAVASIKVHRAAFRSVATTLDGLRTTPATSGALVDAIFQSVETPLFALCRGTDAFFRDHFATLAAALHRLDGARIAASGIINVTDEPGGTTRREFGALLVTDLDHRLLARGPKDHGRFLFTSDLLPALTGTVLGSLDGEEPVFCQLVALLAGPLAQTGYATYLHASPPTTRRSDDAYVARQRQLTRDFFIGNAAWRDRIGNANLAAADWPLPPVEELDLLLQVNRTYVLGRHEEAAAVLGSGFATPEVDHVWITGERGTLAFSWVDAGNLDADYDMVLSMAGLRAEGSRRLQHCSFILNGVPIAYTPVSEEGQDVVLHLPPTVRRSASTFRLEIVPDHRQQPRGADGSVVDRRSLSVVLRSIALVRRFKGQVPTLRVGQIYECTADSRIVRALRRNFYGPEANLIWMLGTESELDFRVDGALERSALQLGVLARAGLDGRPQEVSVFVNDTLVGRRTLAEGRHAISLALEPTLVNLDLVKVVLSLAHAEPVIGNDGEIADGRLLGLALIEIGVINAAAVDAGDNDSDGLTI